MPFMDCTRTAKNSTNNKRGKSRPDIHTDKMGRYGNSCEHKKRAMQIFASPFKKIKISLLAERLHTHNGLDSAKQHGLEVFRTNEIRLIPNTGIMTHGGYPRLATIIV